jgi:hypothetical protein
MRAAAVLVGLLLAGCAPARAATAELDPVLAELAAAHSHGTRDNYATLDNRIERLTAGSLVAYCAEVAAPAEAILTDAGFTVRRVGLLRLTPDEGGVYRGHHLLEAWHPDRERWVSVDLDFGVIYDQRAVTLPTGRVAAEPLETGNNSGDPEGRHAYPYVAQAVGLMRDGVYWYDATAYTTVEEATLRGQLWQPWPGDFTADFYG